MGADRTIPDVKLTQAFTTPFKNAVATARSCYSKKGIIDDTAIDLHEGSRDRQIAKSIYQAGHHTTFQHAQFQFALSRISRQFIWSFLHSHPFYNSEQVSQRYVRLTADSYYIPALSSGVLEIYHEIVALQMEAYERLREMLIPIVAEEYFRLFPARAKVPQKYRNTIGKKAQEVARYVVPIAEFAHLYHTVSGITLMRYWRACKFGDVPVEQRAVVEQMVQAVLKHDPDYAIILEQPLEESDLDAFSGLHAGQSSAFRTEFDASLNGRVSQLVDYKPSGERLVADAVREILGLPKSDLSDDAAIGFALDPAQNSTFGETLNLTTHNRLTRALYHPAYTFRKKLSHTADSQDQRHRMTPGSRPSLSAQVDGDPDYITPELIRSNPAAREFYDQTMDRVWMGIRRLLKAGGAQEAAQYLLPNSVAIRFTESSDLLNLYHKHRMRLCWNAQQEIWLASVDEAEQIFEIHPRLGKYLLAPCTVRMLAGVKPYCPEGDRYCGVPVWRQTGFTRERLL